MMKKKKTISSDIVESSSSGSSRERLQSIPELMANLPTEVVTDILLRLPVKPLVRFRCVSKPWLALIDSPDFIKSHLNRSIEARNNGSLIVKVLPDFPSIPFATYSSINQDSLDVAVEIDHPFGKYSREWYAPRVVGSCNGLMLLSYEKRDASGDVTIVIWNPFTRKYLKLPTTQIESPHHCLKIEKYGIGYDSIHDDYKVVCMIHCDSDNDNGFYLEGKVYSLKSNTWRRIQDFPDYLRLYGRYGVFCCGALHWVVTDSHYEYRCVGAFDVATEVYQSVPMSNFTDKYNICNRVAVLEGCLCMCNYGNEGIDVWVMKNYGVGESWIKLFSVSLPIDNMRHVLITHLALSNDGTKVLYLLDREGHGLIWYDLERKTEKTIDVRGLPRRFVLDFVMQSLVPLGSGSQTYGMKQHIYRRLRNQS